MSGLGFAGLTWYQGEANTGPDGTLREPDVCAAVVAVQLGLVEEAESLFEMKLTCNLINYQQFLTLSRTLIALLAWVLACHEDPYTLFTVPPLEKGPT